MKGTVPKDIWLGNGMAKAQRAYKEWVCEECGEKIERLQYYYAIWTGHDWQPKKRVHIDCLDTHGLPMMPPSWR